MKRARPVTRQFTTTAKWLHWLVAFLLLSILAAAAEFAFIAPADRAGAIPAHASIAMVVVLLTLARLAWRRAVPPPPLPDGTPGWMRRGAGFGHALLYALILFQGLIGIWMAALSPVAIRLFGGFNLSALAPASEGSLVALRQLHFAGAALLGLVIIGHVAAALWHHFRLRDDVLIRMLPFGGLWQRVTAPSRAREARFPSLSDKNWPKRKPAKATRK
jgi:cytochrome b561